MCVIKSFLYDNVLKDVSKSVEMQMCDKKLRLNFKGEF